MGKLQAHTAAHEASLQHRSSPGGAGDGNRDGLGAKLRMSRDQNGTVIQKHRSVAMMLCLDLQDGRRRQVGEKHTTLNLRLDNLMVDLIAEVGMRHEKGYLAHRKLVFLFTVYPHRARELVVTLGVLHLADKRVAT